ncbi:OLC1v1008494C1 [Oldenlandia corymbosa var. corymbosa]|uniref:OLC1v1008494C1 n=1 Tax=Oldenlandia corymbosa var. corymbosa TaxID=529605 RepID=A0AAV1DLQ0_OLDCO|nr:OLC1v1008494C1 [Oldenlandia corymbosa var. corymbosa]
MATEMRHVLHPHVSVFASFTLVPSYQAQIRPTVGQTSCFRSVLLGGEARGPCSPLSGQLRCSYTSVLTSTVEPNPLFGASQAASNLQLQLPYIEKVPPQPIIFQVLPQPPPTMDHEGSLPKKSLWHLNSLQSVHRIY